jgi:hypothetical protein
MVDKMEAFNFKVDLIYQKFKILLLEDEIFLIFVNLT